MLKRNQNPSTKNASSTSNTYERDLVLSLVPKDEELSVHVPVNHCKSGKKPFQWNDIYSQHH